MFHGRLISVSLGSECHYIAPQEENCIASEKKKLNLDRESYSKTLDVKWNIQAQNQI